jgi:hypothetical protein
MLCFGLTPTRELITQRALFDDWYCVLVVINGYSRAQYHVLKS